MIRIQRMYWSRFLIALTVLTLFLNASYMPALAEEDQMPPVGGIIYGHVNGYDINNQLIPLSWAKITALKDGETIIEGYSADGYYEIIVPGGELTLKVEHPGYITQTIDIYVSPSSSTALNFNLERSNEPIPEFTSQVASVILAIALLALLIIMRKRMISR